MSTGAGLSNSRPVLPSRAHYLQTSCPSTFASVLPGGHGGAFGAVGAGPVGCDGGEPAADTRAGVGAGSGGAGLTDAGAGPGGSGLTKTGVGATGRGGGGGEDGLIDAGSGPGGGIGGGAGFRVIWAGAVGRSGGGAGLKVVGD